MSSHYPPGVCESDIPGCSGSDDDWHGAYEYVRDNYTIREAVESLGLDPGVRDADDLAGALGDWTARDIWEALGYE